MSQRIKYSFNYTLKESSYIFRFFVHCKGSIVNSFVKSFPACCNKNTMLVGLTKTLFVSGSYIFRAENPHGSSETGIFVQPSLKTREASKEVLVEENDSEVIGLQDNIDYVKKVSV